MDVIGATVLRATLILAACAPSAAFAGVSNTIRHPTSSSIPCAGTLTEYATEGGNVHRVFQEVTLTCEVQGRVAWVLSGGVSCGELNDERTMDDECGGAVGAR